mmetsp:Transcript_9546/g.14106  ORF Transcript_9546/g.14106 Transcript_9546/m.14106 type:complete len:216 (-) Transcript_9546:25-672(-)
MSATPTTPSTPKEFERELKSLKRKHAMELENVSTKYNKSEHQLRSAMAELVNLRRQSKDWSRGKIISGSPGTFDKPPTIPDQMESQPSSAPSTDSVGEKVNDDQINQLQSQIDDLNSKLKEKDTSIAALKALSDSFEIVMENLKKDHQQQLQSLQDSLDSSQSTISALTEERDQLSSQLSTVSSQNAFLSEQINKSIQKQSQLKKELKKLNKQLS